MLGATYDKLAVQRSRKVLAERIRDDWDKVLAAVAKPSDTNGDRKLAALALPPASALEWRERTYASSDPSSGESSEDEDASSDTKPSTPTTPAQRVSRNGLTSSTRRLFRNHHSIHPDGSDVDGNSSTDSQQKEAEVTRRKQERKRRRRRRLEEEMAWNDGLRNWELTRDLWCRARRVSNEFPQPPPTPSSAGTSLSSSSTVPSVAESKQEGDPLPTPPVLAATLGHPQSALPDRDKNSITQIPIPPPIIPPTDPGRINIESQYSLIFEKVVVESLRPQVPINLSHLVPALVRGWKENDEWPPKSGYPAPASNSARLALAASKNKGKHRSIDLAEKGRRFLWPGYLSSSPKSKSPTLEPGDARREEGAGSSPDHAEKESGTVRRNVAKMTKALRGGLNGTSETKP